MLVYNAQQKCSYNQRWVAGRATRWLSVIDFQLSISRFRASVWP
jgi:hypothetical protein